MNDLIYRQDAIDAMTCDITIKGKENAELVSETIASFFDRVKALPAVNSEPHWILCSEQMPEEHEWIGTTEFGTTISKEVYVTFENPKGERFAKHLSFQNGKLSPTDQQTIDVFYKGSKPIAWTDLPKPYDGSKI